MGAVGTLLLGGLTLVAVWTLAYVLWVRPQRATLTLQSGGLLALIVLAFAGALGGAPAWWADQPGSFSWDLPPLASRMLAAAAAAFVVAAVLTLQRPSYRRVRVMLLLIAVYLVPLLVVIPVAHRDRFDASAPITYGFFGLVGLMSGSALWYVFRQPRVIVETAADAEPARAWLRSYLAVVALVAGGWGLALFLTDDGPSRLVWAWPGDLLTSRLIAVMLLALAVGALAGLRDRATARLMLVTVLVYGCGVVLATYWNTVADKPIQHGYLIGFGLIAATAGTMLFADWLTGARPVARAAHRPATRG